MSREPAYRILVLGGYGNFGARIVDALASQARCHLLIAGRDAVRAGQAAARLRGAAAVVEGMGLDAHDPQFAQFLRQQRIDLVIHTAGPFQGQSYEVARACIEAGAHYVDLADGRAFVTGITALDAAARERNVLVVSGASTVPALSAAVLDRYRSRFDSIATVSIGITPGNRTPRGLSTVESVLSYCGKPFERWQRGRWQRVYGWQDQHRVFYPRLGWRWFANCDVPDLSLFPLRYGVTDSVKFHAGLELRTIQWSLWLMSWLARWRIVSNWRPAARFLRAASELLLRFGSDAGGMHVVVTGTTAGRQRRIEWLLTALAGHGPQIPCIAAIVIARKLASGRWTQHGAMPCLDLMTLDEFDDAVKGMEIGWQEKMIDA
ncbi:MAG TPA: saccharopine dehydrogenase NADP-binding domain-containing protein [Povalibacter sp.]|uniref:saccharopine dehydrogenase family protein n=1 Tax=Povalibacter sp. TaxID=1962978 RepID=UPI002B6082E8|nr:saccharopine dehydrogenase NADP-binding domain-containing protein [Povalibacter sp.]HMN44255.1 saccharopine dehydrogenase NADP-binding domain-containing protein [Povalibacter sp.]